MIFISVAQKHSIKTPHGHAHARPRTRTPHDAGMRVTAAHTRAPRVYVLLEREFRRLRLPRATTPATLATTVSEYAGDAACDELAETLAATTGALRVRVFFCSGKRAVVAFVHEQQEGGQPACIVGLERACELAGAPAAAVFAGLWRRIYVESVGVHAHA